MDARDFVKIEGVPQLLHRVVLRSVVDHHDLVVAILERENRGDARLDGRALVVRRDENRDRRQGVTLHQALEVFIFGQPCLLPDLWDRENQQHGIQRVQDEEVDEDSEVRGPDDGGERTHAANSASACAGNPRTSCAIARAKGSPPTSASSSALRPGAAKRISARAARKRTHQTSSCSAAFRSGSVLTSAIMPSERTACARTAHASSTASRLSAATDSRCGKLPSARADCTRTSGSAWSASAVRRSRSEERRVGKECRSRWSPYH